MRLVRLGKSWVPRTAARVRSWGSRLLQQVPASSSGVPVGKSILLKANGSAQGQPCQPGQTAAVTGCIPQSGASSAPVHQGSGLPIGQVFSKVYKGVAHTIEVTSQGFSVSAPGLATQTYTSLTAAAKGVRGSNTAINGWAFFNIPKPVTPANPAALPPPSHAPSTGSPSNVGFANEMTWKTGDPKSGQVLHGVPFEKAPPKFWEKTQDVNVGEPKPVNKIRRAGILVQEPDGRIWIVEPTNHYGDRKHTLPGGGTEPGLTDQQNALKEVWEETGLQVEITGHLGDFEDSNNGNIGRLYIGKRIGGAPWDAKIESSIINRKTGQQAAESENVKLVTLDEAAKLLHRTDDLAQLATVRPIHLDAKTSGNMMKKLVASMEPAVKSYKEKKKAAGQAPGNSHLNAVQNLRGMNKKPKVVNKADMDQLVKAGTHIELLRGVKDYGTQSAKELAEDFKSGDHFPGYGCFGSGTYADSNKGSSNAATSNYGRGGDIIRMALPKTAKIVKYTELEKLVGSAPQEFGNAYSGPHTATYDWMGVQAALAGYDAIHVDGNSRNHGSYGQGFYVVLNRGAVVVQKESAKGHVIKMLTWVISLRNRASK